MRPRNFILRTTRHAQRATLFALTMLLIQTAPLYAASMSDYCLVPPYVARTGVPPNITVVYEKGVDIVKGAYYNCPYGTVYNAATATCDTPSQFPDYYGFFKSTANYSYNTASEYFEQPSTACTPNGTNNCFSGKLLNWAFMSSLDLARKALIGFGWDDTLSGLPLAGDAFTYSGKFCHNAGSWTSNGTVCSNQDITPISYTDLEDGNKCVNANVTISGTDYSIAFNVKQTGGNAAKLDEIKYKVGFTTGAPTCSGTYTDIVSIGGSGGKIAMKFKTDGDSSTWEPRTGLVQKYADKDINYQYDTDVPRFGVKRWNSGAAQQEDIIKDSPALTATESATFFRDLLSAISKSPGTDPTTSYLGTMHKQIVNYFKGSSSTYQDNDTVSQTPYDWANDPLKACRKTFALYVTTGTYLGQDADKLSPLPSACSSLTYTDAFPTNTCYAYNTDLYTTDGTPPKQNITTYVVHTTFYGAGAGNEAKLTYAANISDGVYLKVDDPNKFEQVLETAILDMLKRAASGTAASVLASGQGEGANILQAVFYPRTPKLPLGIYEKRIEWIGRLTNFWYYVDPFFSTSTILEDTTSDDYLNLSNDKTVTLRYDTTLEKTVGDLYTYGSATPSTTGVAFESLKYLWEAGTMLWNRDITVAANKRKIYTTTNGTSLLSGNFSADTNNGDSDNSSTLLPYFDLSATDSDGDGFKDGDLNHDGSVNSTDASILIRYLHGEDFPSSSWLRSRTTAIDLNGDGDTADTVTINGVSVSESAKVWKLGDILNSTPRISSWVQLNTYDTIYSDTTYGDFLKSANYTGRGMVFTGGNDGMLHAFNLGKLEIPNQPSYITKTYTFDSSDKKACLSGTAANFGKEIWAFIPKNVLPYLKYLTDTGYCHLYSVDLTPYIFDASIGAPGTGDISNNTKDVNSWRTILIGGMRYGGACRDAAGSCNGGTDCVKTPVSGNGFSSYFALDVTDQNNPTLLWEFSDSTLGFATTGPAVVRIGADTSKNGKWFVVFGSGPTGPISTSDQQFLGRSDQPLKIFVRNLKDGTEATTITTTILNAFAGSMLNETMDTSKPPNYSDDVVYIPYVKKTGSTWTDGGVLRLSTKESPDPVDATNPWVMSTVIDGIGPVTSSIVKLQNTKKGQLWLYFGTGRYYFEQSATVDDADSQRKLYGVLEPCFTSSGVFDATCTSSVTGSLTDVTSNASADSSTVSTSGGWYINLDASGSYTYSGSTKDYRAERVITDPLSTTTGLVFFTTYKPYNDICSYGGKSFIWAMKYDTGGAPGALLKGTALLQTSTGSIEQLKLSTAFSDAGGRKTTALEGVPPTSQGLSIITTPAPAKRIIHIRER